MVLIQIARLTVTEQPKEEFYKDEGTYALCCLTPCVPVLFQTPSQCFFHKHPGGKSNFLQCTVSLTPVGKLPENFSAIPLLITIFFESGSPVEANDRTMFKLLGGPCEIKSDKLSTQIRFRLDKVFFYARIIYTHNPLRLPHF